MIIWSLRSLLTKNINTNDRIVLVFFQRISCGVAPEFVSAKKRNKFILTGKKWLINDYDTFQHIYRIENIVEILCFCSWVNKYFYFCTIKNFYFELRLNILLDRSDYF